MKLSIKFLKRNAYTQADDVVPEGTEYGFWRVVEHTGAGWFAWPDLFHTKEAALLRKYKAEVRHAKGLRVDL